METILDIIRNDLAERRGDWRAICASAKVDYFWLSKFVRGTIKEPGYLKIERLKQYLAENPRQKAA